MTNGMAEFGTNFPKLVYIVVTAAKQNLWNVSFAEEILS